MIRCSTKLYAFLVLAFPKEYSYDPFDLNFLNLTI